MPGQPVATIGSLHNCPMCNGSVPHVGGPVLQGATNVLVGGVPVAKMGDLCSCTGPPDVIATGHPTVLVNGQPIATVGDMTGHGGVIVSGNTTVIIGSRGNGSGASPKAVLSPKSLPQTKVGSEQLREAIEIGEGDNLRKALAGQEHLRKMAVDEHGEPEEDEKPLPKLEGEIIFCNGYLSSPYTNPKGSLNALLKQNPDTPGWMTSQGQNTNEKDRTDPVDRFTAQERQMLEERRASQALKKEEKKQHWLKKWKYGLKDKAKNTKPGKYVTYQKNKFKYTKEEKYYGYWNSRTNNYYSTKTYAKFFNAENRIHYINGSHGLRSNGAHRFDHGFAQGYAWAAEMYFLLDSADVEKYKAETPELESHTPAYKPVTIVGHSQGACMAAGVAMGVVRYAADKGYDSIPINIVLLGIHQPHGLHTEEYDQLIKLKCKKYKVDETFFTIGLDKEEKGDRFMNSLSKLFDPKEKVLYHNRGLAEHLKALGVWDTFQKRTIQFTFTNDRGDIVLRDGDITGIKSACHLIPDSSLLSAEVYIKLPDEILKQNKEVIDLKALGGLGGFLVVPKYLANRRFDFTELIKKEALGKDQDVTKEERTYGDEWGDYHLVAIRWGNAMYKFQVMAYNYKQIYDEKFVYPGNSVSSNLERKARKKTRGAVDFVRDKIPLVPTRSKEELKKTAHYNLVADAYEDMLRRYAALQNADLYAHFSPVSLILHEKFISDFPEDVYGNTSVWERIKLAGADRYYRVEYASKQDDQDEISDQEKRIDADSFVRNFKNIRKLTKTSITKTPYFTAILDAFVLGIKEAEKKLYEEVKDDV